MKCLHASKIAVFYLFVLTTPSATFTGILLKFGSVFILVEYEKHLMETKLTITTPTPIQLNLDNSPQNLIQQLLSNILSELVKI